MREILFRGKRVDNGEWVYGYYCHVGYTGSEKHYIIPTYASAFYEIEIVPETVGQYTGLNDKNGRKFFEGDIVKYRDCIGVVEWDLGRSRFMVTFGGTDNVGFGQINLSVIEIVGNIHDTQKLLEVE